MRSRTSTWFETKVKYQKTMEDGSEKVVSEAYVVDALYMCFVLHAFIYACL